LGFGSAWSNIEDPFPQTQAQQCAVAKAQGTAPVALYVSVDGGAPVDFHTPRFEKLRAAAHRVGTRRQHLGRAGPRSSRRSQGTNELSRCATFVPVSTRSWPMPYLPTAHTSPSLTRQSSLRGTPTRFAIAPSSACVGHQNDDQQQRV
jgi:hypothetical protein